MRLVSCGAPSDDTGHAELEMARPIGINHGQHSSRHHRRPQLCGTTALKRSDLNCFAHTLSSRPKYVRFTLGMIRKRRSKVQNGSKRTPTPAADFPTVVESRCRHSGALIVNADDWGLEPAVTDQIALCFKRGAISSTTAMVWMADSERAAEIARERAFPVGLHLNLDTRFEGTTIPKGVRDDHERIRRWFGNPKRPALLYNPSRAFQHRVDRCIAAQLGQFRIQYGRDPTHVDAHHHLHLAWNVLFSRVLQPGLRVRATQWRRSSAPGVMLIRRIRMWMLRRKFVAPDRFYDIRAIHPVWGGDGLQVLQEARVCAVEVMVHPGFPGETSVLLSDDWIRAIHAQPLTSFDAFLPGDRWREPTHGRARVGVGDGSKFGQDRPSRSRR
jgi:predicted glycoside hydrolase/deacetylase ChbG (UPF0249 family)